jgi:hypothetical protein
MLIYKRRWKSIPVCAIDLGNEGRPWFLNLSSWPRVFEQLFCIYREVCANYRRS